MEDALQRAEKAWSEMDKVTREVVAETLFMLVVKHARSLWLKNQELEADAALLREAMTTEPTAEMLASVCLSYRHDFGLLEDKRQGELKVMALDWWRAVAKEMQARTALKEAQHDLAT